MRTLETVVAVLAVSLAAGTGPAIVPVPSLTESTATMPGATGEIPTLMIVPDGSGPGFAEATDPLGNPIDAIIELIVNDDFGYPIANFPWQDLWLEADDQAAGPFVCPTWYPGSPYGWLHPDDYTDDLGSTRWTGPPVAGGYTAGPVFVLINGERLLSNAGLALRFNSPDINGDMKVNLSDVVILAGDYHGEYHFRSDLECDGVINLSDIARFASHLGASCP